MEKKTLIGRVQIGTRVKILAAQYEGLLGTIRFIGPLQGTVGQWIGVQLDEQRGSHNGQYKGHNYFLCKKNHGMFLKPRNVGLQDGPCLQQLMQVPKQQVIVKPQILNSSTKKDVQTQKQKKNVSTVVKKQTKKQTKAPTNPRTTIQPVVNRPQVPQKQGKQVVPKLDSTKQKLSNELIELQMSLNTKIASLQQSLAKSEQQIKILKQRPLNQQNDELKDQLAKLKENYRVLTNQKDKVESRVSTNQQQKYKQLEAEMNFYKSEKQKSQKQRKRMQKRMQKMEQQLNQLAQHQQMIQKLSQKCQNLQAKNQTLRIQLQNAKTQLKNVKINNVSKTITSSTDSTSEQLLQQITTLNQTIVLLQSELTQTKQKFQALQKQTQGSSNKLSQFTKLQKKLKAKQQQVAQLKQALDQHSDAVAFAQQISMKKMKIQQQLQNAKSKINELINQKDYLQQVQQSHQELTHQLEHEVNNKELQIEKLQQVIKDKDIQIQDHLKQIGKYKQKISSLILKLNQYGKNQLQTSMTSLTKQNSSIVQTSNYNNLKYIEVLKYAELINLKFIKLQNQTSIIKNKAGVFLLNILEGLPAEFSEKFYPQGIDLLVTVKTSKDKIYYLFDQIFNQLRQKNQLYSEQNAELSNWMIMVFIKLQKAFHRLYRIQLLISGCETQEQLADIVTRRNIKQQALYIDGFSTELITQLADNSVSAGISLQRLDNSIRILQQQNNSVIRNLPKQQQTKISLCSQTMKCITFSCEMILNYRVLAELKQNAQIDMTFQSFLKKIGQYLKQLCLNQHIRYKPKMANYLDGLNFISDIYKQIQTQNLILNLQNLNDRKEQISILKQSILTVQNYIKQLLVDLNQLSFTDELKKFKTKLPGSIWQTRIQFIRNQLLKVKQLGDQKNQLQIDLLDSKKKIYILQKQLKDKSIVRDLLQKRIGQLQLKVQQVTVLQNDIKRLNQKIRNAQEGSRAMQQQIQNLLKKKSQNQEEIKRLKQKLDTLATQVSAKQPVQKLQASNVMNINSIPVKNLLKQNSALKNCQLKQKISALRYSEVVNNTKSEPFDQFKSLRRSTLSAMVQTKISIPGEPNKNENAADRLFLQFEKIMKQKKQRTTVKNIQIGSVWINSNSIIDSKTVIGKFRYHQLQNVLPQIVMKN